MIDEIAGKIVNRIRTNKHPNRRNNEVVAAMYAMYLLGPEGRSCSLADIARLYKKTRQAVYDVFRTRGYELRHKSMRCATKIGGVVFTETKAGALRGTTPSGRTSAQRWVWEKANGPVPEGFVVRHLDGDPKNNFIENLELVAKSRMSVVFNPEHRNQFSKI